ncbi:transposase [Streptomyces sp. NBC_01454]
MGEGSLLVELTRHLMQAAVEAEMDQHLGEEAGRTGGWGSRSGGNARNDYRPRKVMTEVGAVAVQVPTEDHGGDHGLTSETALRCGAARADPTPSGRLLPPGAGSGWTRCRWETLSGRAVGKAGAR